MALSFSQSVVKANHPLPLPLPLPLLRPNPPCSTSFRLKFPSLTLVTRCSSASAFKDKTLISLKPRTQNDLTPTQNDNTLACHATASKFGGQENDKSYVEAYAIGRNIRMSADKARRVIDQIRGRSYEETLTILELMPYRACEAIIKIVFSAGANASNNLGLSKGSLVICKAEVNEGRTLKRMRPVSRGRGYPIRKRTCHIAITVKGLPSKSVVEATPA
ncbi:60S ribosomal protein L22 [Stylosanthes scabra]|uniref:Large ribosomal subunit protein uL22c n=1 Tax=Stylosanthes scabra TaxID=79078 RepID=A0ABU6U8X4_9FABA|nr:60S ribosomal protein L22 [Stylosanthes scabra]